MVLTAPRRGHGAAAPDRQLLVIGDVHGRAGALERMLGHLAALPARGGGRDLVFLGDLIDRGPGSLRAVRLAWGAHGLADRVLPLPGNHELMLMDVLAELEPTGEAGPDAGMWLRNGGEAVLREVDPEGRLPPAAALRAVAEALPKGFLTAVRHGPTHHEAGGFLLVHTGLHPHIDRGAFLARPRERAGDDDHWAWIREPFLGWTGAGAGRARRGGPWPYAGHLRADRHDGGGRRAARPGGDAWPAVPRRRGGRDRPGRRG